MSELGPASVASAGSPESSSREALVAAHLELSLIPGVGPRTRQALLERFGSPSAVLAAKERELRAVDGVGPKLARSILDARQTIDVAAELRLCREHGLQLLVDDEPLYPRLLKELPDPPGILFLRGELLPRDGFAIAIVGTRHATPYGARQAERLASGLARAGLTIVSGLAHGIDAVAHRAAVEAGGRTIAVLGSGLLNLYPPDHGKLADQVARSGVLLSEMPPRFHPMRGAFPQRNRLISGLSLGVIVVEAATRSGALITAKHANEQGREVFAVPGPIDSRVSHGCHQLIRDGARLVESVDDVLEELGPLVESTPVKDGPPIRHPAELALNEQEQAVLAAVGAEATTIDEVTARSGLPIHRVLSTISVLEMRRLVRRISGQLVVRY